MRVQRVLLQAATQLVTGSTNPAQAACNQSIWSSVVCLQQMFAHTGRFPSPAPWPAQQHRFLAELATRQQQQQQHLPLQLQPHKSFTSRWHGNSFCNGAAVQSASLTTSRLVGNVLTGDSRSAAPGSNNGQQQDEQSPLQGSSSRGKGWVETLLPLALQPYAQLARLDKPIGSWLLAWPGLWAIALAAPAGQLPDAWLTTLFGVGAVLMRGAGCTINDLWDRDIDARVARTAQRPLPRGAVGVPGALGFLAVQLSAALAVLLQLNFTSQALGVASLALVITYPLMKRITWWPQAFLGLAMNYGALMGTAAAASDGSLNLAVAAPLYAAGVCWTLVYDTIYAHQDKRDDMTVGVRSTALLLGVRGTRTAGAAFAAAQAALLCAAGSAAGVGPAFYAGVMAGAAHQTWQLSTAKLNDPADCMAKFVSNKWYGALIYAGIIGNQLL